MAYGTGNRERIVEHIANLDNFQIGNVKGWWYPTGLAVPRGQLWQALRAELDGCGAGERPVYAVFSYFTPIAWRAAGLPWHCPAVRYSVPTSHHQSLARQGIDRSRGRYEGTR